MPRAAMNGVRTHVILTIPQHKAIQKLSKTSGLPVSEILRRAVDTYLTKEKKSG